MKTAREIVKETNELAHLLLQQKGGHAPSPDFKFYRAAMGDFRSTFAWREAVQAYELVTKHRVADALAFVLDHGEEEPPKDSELVAALKAMACGPIPEADMLVLLKAAEKVSELERIEREAKAFDDKMDDVENDGRDAVSPTGDDYNHLMDIIRGTGNAV